MILLTGGTGFIGSHIAVELLNNNKKIHILDNLSNSSVDVLKGIKKITGKDFIFDKVDLRNRDSLEKVFRDNSINAVIHLAGLKSVKKSNENPSDYLSNNVEGTKNLIVAMQKAEVKKIVFSSSATVYGNPKSLPIKESCEVGKTSSFYGQTKVMVENFLRETYNNDKEWKISVLRYFNPIGAHKSGFIGENPKGIPDNLLPYIFQVATGDLESLKIFGDDYLTPDGTGIRDYIHVDDLAKGHIAALKYLELENTISFFNLGTGKGYSVFDILKTFKKVSGIDIPYQIVGRRSGDVAEIYSDVSLAKECLNWNAKKNIDEMIADGWNWQRNNKKIIDY